MALTDNLVSYYKLDESSGNAADSVGSNTLTNNGTTAFAPGKINNGADLEAGSSNYFSIADASQTGLDFTGDFSLSCWLKFESLPSSSQFGILDKWLSTGDQLSYLIDYNTNGTAGIRVFTSSTGGGAGVAGGQANFTASTATWYHLVVSKSGTTTTVYIDDSSVGTITNSNAIFDGTSALFLGNENDASRFFDGIIDEVGLWSRALTSGEVTTLYNGGAGIQYPFSAGTTTHNLTLLGVGN